MKLTLPTLLFHEPFPIPRGIGRFVRNMSEGEIETAVCTKCGKEKPVGLFFSNGPGRIYSSCSECVLNAKRAARAAAKSQSKGKSK